MKARILVGAVAALLYSGVALAGGNKDCPPGSKDTRAGMDSEYGEGRVTVIETEPRDGYGGAGDQTGAFTPADRDDEMRQDERADMRGLTVTLGGGVEGYTGALAPQINPGPAYGVTVAIKPSRVVGLELGYSGAVNNLDGELLDLDEAPDIVRNGGQAALTFGLTATPVQPYLLGGVGISNYNVRGEAGEAFSDDTVVSTPLGAGLRTHIGDFTLDLRGNYNFLFNQDFADVNTGLNETGRYAGTLNIGGTF